MTEPLLQLQQDCRAYFEALWHGETQPFVFGDGNNSSPTLMLIGEAPGEQEAIQGKPFVGKAGKNLTHFLDTIQLNRSELYISNVVKIRPSRISASGRRVNRPPTRGEIELFLPWLHREIALVQPRALVTLGNVALHAFIGPSETIGSCHGRWHNAMISSPESAELVLPLFALYHPASVIYNRALTEVYATDLQTLRDTLHTVASQETLQP